MWIIKFFVKLCCSASDSGKTLLTPSEKRKNLILQHQQRSSMDTEAIDIDHPSVAMMQLTHESTTLQTRNFSLFIFFVSFPQSHLQPRTSTIPAPIPQSQSPSRKSFDTLRMPSIAVTPSTSSAQYDECNKDVDMFQRPTIFGTIRSDVRRKSADPIEPIYSNM